MALGAAPRNPGVVDLTGVVTAASSTAERRPGASRPSGASGVVADGLRARPRQTIVAGPRRAGAMRARYAVGAGRESPLPQSGRTQPEGPDEGEVARERGGFGSSRMGGGI